MKNDEKRKIASSAALTLLAPLVGILSAFFIPLKSGAEMGSVALLLFGMGAGMAAVDVLCLYFTARDRGNEGQSRKIIGVLYAVLPLISIACTAITVSAFAGIDLGADHLTAFLIGVLFIVFGNYMPKTKRNATVGIKIKWTLENDENWNATHRMAAKLWVIGGFLVAFTAFAPVAVALPVMLSVIAVLVIVPIVYSYRMSRRQKKDGSYTVKKDDIGVSFSRGGAVATGILIALVIIAVTVLLFTGNIKFTIGDGKLDVKASYYADISLPLESIDSVELVEGKATGSRTFGFGSPRLSMGQFENSELGTYTRYTVSGSENHILIKAGGRTYVFALSGTEETEALFSDIKNSL